MRVRRVIGVCVGAGILAWLGGCTCAETHGRTVADGGRDGASDATTDATPEVDGGDAGTPCDWEPWNSGLVGGQVSEVAFDPRVVGRAYLTSGANVFESTDHGASWSLRTDRIGLWRLAFPPQDDDALLGASGHGLVASTDRGSTWATQALSGLTVRTVAVAPSNPLRVYAAIDLVGIVRSTDGGSSWASVVNGVPASTVHELGVDPEDPDHVVAVGLEAVPSCDSSACAILLETHDGGATWTQVGPADKRSATAVAYCPANPAVILASAGSTVWRTEDGGDTWAPVPLVNQRVQGLGITGASCETVYAAGFVAGVFRSDDGGDTWAGPFTDGITDLSHAPNLDGLAVDPLDGGRLFVASRAGLFVSVDAGEHWTPVEGIGVPPVRALAVAGEGGPTPKVWMATWGTGLWHRTVGNAGWEHVPTSAFGTDFVQTVAPSPNDPSILIAATLRSVDDGASFEEAGISPAFAVAFDPNRAGVVAAATQTGGVYLGTSEGATFAAANGDLVAWVTDAGTFIDARAVTFVGGATQTWLVGTNGRGIQRTTNDGETWAEVGYPTRHIPCLVENAATGTLFACVEDQGVARSKDGGLTWELASAGLLTMNASDALYDARFGGVVVGTAEGIFGTLDDGDSWNPVGQSDCVPGGLANPVIFEAGGQVWLAATSGGAGVYRHLLLEADVR